MSQVSFVTTELPDGNILTKVITSFILPKG